MNFSEIGRRGVARRLFRALRVLFFISFPAHSSGTRAGHPHFDENTRREEHFSLFRATAPVRAYWRPTSSSSTRAPQHARLRICISPIVSGSYIVSDNNNVSSYKRSLSIAIEQSCRNDLPFPPAAALTALVENDLCSFRLDVSQSSFASLTLARKNITSL